MKKLLLFTLAAGISLSAMAIDNTMYKLPTPESMQIKKEIKSSLPYISMEKAVENDLMHKAPRRASADELSGLWLFTLGDFYDEAGTMSPFTAYYDATVENDIIMFTVQQGELMPMTALYSESKSTITFKRVMLGKITDQNMRTYYVYQEPFVYNYTTQDLDYQDITGTYNNGRLTMKDDNGIAWVGYDDEAGNKFAGYFYIYDIMGAVHNVNQEVEDKWADIGNGTIVDGWVLPAFGIDQFDPENIYEVPMQYNVKNPNVYRLVNPYKRGPLAEDNEYVGDGYIMFDVSDPDHVVFLKSNAGFAFAEAGIYDFYCFNQLGTLYAQFGFLGITPAELVQMQGDAIPYSVLKDNTITLTSIPFKGDTMYDANFGYQGDPDGGYAWRDDKGKVVNMDAQISFPEGYVGVKGLEFSELAEPVYYNLQGVKVTNPEKGQILIVNKGNKSEKIIF